MVLDYFSRYKKQLIASFGQRTEFEIPRISQVIIAVVSFVLIFIVVSLLFPRGDNRAYHFVEESGSVTVLSAIFLAMAAGLSFVSFFISPKSAGGDKRMWLLLTMAFLFLSFDELLGFHEAFGAKLDNYEGGISIVSRYFRHWNDIIVIAYGLLAVPFGLYFLPVVLRYPRFFETLFVAASLYVIHTFVDSVVEPPTVKSIVIEESLKLFCSAFLALSTFVGLLGVLYGKLLPTKIKEYRSKKELKYT
jgi:hypothetical protein